MKSASVFLLASFLLLFTNIFSQSPTLRVSKDYFKPEPFHQDLSDFLKELLRYPGLSSENKKFIQRSDSNLFYFAAAYKNYSPFFFKPKRVAVVLEDSPVAYNDSLPPDTLLRYQLIAVADDNPTGISDIKKEFERIHRRYGKKFYSNNYQDLKRGNEVIGGLYNYFEPYLLLAPVSVFWLQIPEEKEIVLNISIRFTSAEGRIVLPTLLYDSK